MYYVTELNLSNKLSRSYTPRKSHSVDNITYKHLSTVSRNINRLFKYNPSIDYISLNRQNIKPKPVNRLRIRTLIIRQSITIDNIFHKKPFQS